MNRESAAINIVSLFAQQIEQLGVAHGDQEIEGVIRIGHDKKKSCLPVTQGVQFQLVISSQIPQLLNIEGCQSCTAGDQDGFCGFARNELSRTF